MDTKASQGDGSRRRSFLPAPKRASESQFAAQQANTSNRMIQSQLPILQPAHVVYPRESPLISSMAAKPTPLTVGVREQTGALPRTVHFMENIAFGAGLHIGARVRIGGVKPGILRYLGPTHLAPGIFCGIELLDPDGNHNGEVNGHRYFFCLPNHGIFAPKEKVCLDTSNDAGSLVSDSDSYYSSLGSLTDKRHRQHKNYAEGEFHARAFSKSSNLTSPYGTQYVQDAAHSQRHRDTEGARTSNLPSPYNTQTERSYNTQSERPYNTQTERSYNTQTERSYNTQSERPYNTQTERSYNTQSERPYNTQTERPPNTQTGRSEALQSHGYSESLHQLPNSGVPTAGKSSVMTTSSPPRLPNYSRAYNKYNHEFHPRRSPAYSSQSDSSQTSSHEALTDLQDSISDFEMHQERDRSGLVYTKYGANPDRSDENSLMKDTLSTDVKHQLGADSRHFLDFSFNSDELNRSREFEERESDSSFLDDEFEAKYGNTVHENSRGPVSARAERLDAGMSESYTIFRAGLDAANASQTRGEGNSSNIGVPPASHCLGEKEGSGLLTDFHTYKDERIFAGYVPDIDSELGALISSTPGGDWVDRCGVSHPTTYAPLDGDVTTDAEKKDKNDLVKTAANLSSKTAVKASDDDDYNSDLTGNPEDDRVEADRLDGQDSKAARGAREPVSIDVSNKEGHENEKEASVTPETSPESPTITDFHGKDGKTEDTTPEVKGKPRKPIVITKKRSENVDHKMPNTNVTSRLADYIKAPVPVKPKEEREKDIKKKQNKNVKNASESSTKSKQEVSRAPSEDGDNKAEEKLEKPKPIIKRERPKSKWDNIMCQIETSKDTVKVKPISEVKSTLAEYLHSPLPQLSPDDAEAMPSHPRKEFKSKLKPLPPPPPKIDFSKVKSKLNVPTAASAIKTLPKREKPPKTGNLKSDNRASRASSTALNADLVISESSEDARKMSDSSMVLEVHPATSQTDLSALENKDGSVQPQGKEGLLSKSSPGDTKKESTEKSKSSADHVSKPGEGIKKAIQSTSHQSKKAVTSAPKVTRNAVSNNIRSSRSTSKSVTKKEFEELELLYEARAEEVVQLKTQLDATIQAFDAMAILANYCSNELNAFECPRLSQKLEAVQRQLEEYAQQIVELNSQKTTLDKDLDQVMQEKEEAAHQTKEAQDSAQKQREEHEQLTHDLSDTHMTALTTQRDELSAKHEETLNKLTQFYETQLQMQRQAHERQVSDIMNECKLEINSLKISNLEEIQELRNKHDDQMEELHKQHRNKMEEISLRFEAIKFSLSEKVDCLRKECDDLAVRARNSEEALQKDADFKVRIALAPFLHLPSEIESLKSIQGMRLEEIQKLRTKILDLEKQLEEVPIGREKIISLQQKIENLEAIISIKTEHEKQLHQRCQVLMRKYDRESRANKRISQDFEQIMWRMSQSVDFDSCDSLTKQQLSQSHYERAPDSSRHSASPHRDGGHQVRRRSSKSNSEGDRKLRSKSANSVAGTNDGSYDPTSSSGSHLKLDPHSKKSHIAENEHFNRMCQSAGPEVMFELLSDHSCPQTELDRQEEQTVTGPQVTSIFDMTSSYARSLSGVTDSGVYDSLTRSDVFNSSTASTDLDLGASVNLSVTCDSTAEDAHESGPAAGDYHLA